MERSCLFFAENAKFCRYFAKGIRRLGLSPKIQLWFLASQKDAS